ncbi:MAG: hypothetical protein JRJ73_14815 [Deltaproteobacteria bacterium]|nr:hypothetical protein [Deltaproteobacteria bacterium]
METPFHRDFPQDAFIIPYTPWEIKAPDPDFRGDNTQERVSGLSTKKGRG